MGVHSWYPRPLAYLEVLSTMSTATELIKRSILGTSGFLEVQCRMLSATELTKGLFRGSGQNSNND